MASHNPESFHPHVHSITPQVFACVRDSYYRISAEALRVCCELVHVLKPNEVFSNCISFLEDNISSFLYSNPPLITRASFPNYLMQHWTN